MNKQSAENLKTVCPNCRNFKPATDKFCSICGQKHTNLNESIWHVICDAFVQFFSLDGRVFRTLFYLLFRPGFLSSEYRIGRRQRYIGPIQIFLISSVCYFFAVGMTLSVMEISPQENPEVAEIINNESKKQPNQKSGQTLILGKKDDGGDSQGKKELVDMDTKISFVLINQELRVSLREIQQMRFMTDNELADFLRKRGVKPDFLTVRLARSGSVIFGKGGFRYLIEKIVELGAQLSMFLVPILAILVRIFYLFKEKRTLHTAVFSAHIHAAVLLIGAIMAVCGLPTIFLISSQTIVFMAYLFLGLKQFYGQGWIFTSIKTFFVFITYFFLLSFAISFLLLLALVTL